MTSIKNEHIVCGYGEREDGKGQVVLVGLTDLGLKYLKDNPGKTLLIEAPGTGFTSVANIVVYAEKDKATLKETVAQGRNAGQRGKLR